MKVQFILNPCSGRNRRRPWLAAAIQDFARTHLTEASLSITESAGHATELARSAVNAGCNLVVAVGGDGTMNEVAQAALHSPATLALVPCGSGNGLALHLGLPRTLRGALGLIASPDQHVAAIDTGLVNDRPFFNAMGLGFDAEVSRRFNGLTRRGLPAYVRAALRVMQAAQPVHCSVATDGQRVVLEALLIAVANSDQYGNNARIAPGADVTDGILDLVAVTWTHRNSSRRRTLLHPANVLRLAGLAARLFAGRIDESRHVQRLRGARFVIERQGPGLIHTDGETHEGDATLSVRVSPRSLRVLVPATSRLALARATPVTNAFALQLP